MGRWDTGTFDADRPLDFLGNIIDDFKQSVELDLKAAESGQGELERDALPAIACLRALVRSIGPARKMLDGNDVARWRDAFFEWFDANYQETGAIPEVIEAIRSNAVKEFDDLQAELSHNA